MLVPSMAHAVKGSAVEHLKRLLKAPSKNSSNRILNKNTISQSCVRNGIDKQGHASSAFQSKFFKSYHKVDGVTLDHATVYHFHKSAWLKPCYILTSVCVVPTVLASLFILINNVVGTNQVFAVIAVLYGGFLVEALRRIITRAPVRVYWHEVEDNYTMILYNSFCFKQKVKFHHTDVTSRKSHVLFKEITGNYVIKQKPVLLFANDFQSNAHYTAMCELANETNKLQ